MWHYIPETDRFRASLAISANPEDADDSDMCFREDAKPSDEQGSVMADALTVHEATGLTPSQLQARVAELEAALAEQDRVLRSSVPERWKGCVSPVGSAQCCIAELEDALMRVRLEAVADDQDDWFRAAGEAIEP